MVSRAPVAAASTMAIAISRVRMVLRDGRSSAMPASAKLSRRHGQRPETIWSSAQRPRLSGVPQVEGPAAVGTIDPAVSLLVAGGWHQTELGRWLAVANLSAEPIMAEAATKPIGSQQLLYPVRPSAHKVGQTCRRVAFPHPGPG